MLQHLSIFWKMLIVTVIAGASVFGILDLVQSRHLKQLFSSQLNERLQEQARRNRTSFDKHVQSYHKIIKVIATQHKFIQYLEKVRSQGWPPESSGKTVRYEGRLPEWLPGASVLRSLSRVKNVLLLDGTGKVREIFLDHGSRLPEELLKPTNVIWEMGRSQSFMTRIGELPLLIASEIVETEDGETEAILLLVTPLDDDFIRNSQDTGDNDEIFALVDSRTGIIRASSKPDVLPSGKPLDALEDRFLVTGKSFFDYGASDLEMQFASLISIEKYESLTNAILSKERSNRAITAILMIVSFSLIMALITRRLSGLTTHVMTFSNLVLGVQQDEVKHGDEIMILDRRFRLLTEKITRSQERLKKQAVSLRAERDRAQSLYDELKSTQSQMLQREKMASIGQLAAGVAHEINNPMGFITSNLRSLDKYMEKLLEFINTQTDVVDCMASSGCVEGLKNLKKKLKIDYIAGDAGDLIHESLEGAERVKVIVQNLKSFSRVDEAEYKPADINECIESALNIVWNEIKYKATVKKELGDLPMTKCRPQQLNQVFLNLLVNASHAIEKEGEIEIKTRNSSKAIHIRISDTGSGIPEDKIGKIFEPFFTTKEVGEGTGLGLSIAYDIVKKHNGDIKVESETGKGTAFTVLIPVVDDNNPEL